MLTTRKREHTALSEKALTKFPNHNNHQTLVSLFNIKWNTLKRLTCLHDSGHGMWNCCGTVAVILASFGSSEYITSFKKFSWLKTIHETSCSFLRVGQRYQQWKKKQRWCRHRINIRGVFTKFSLMKTLIEKYCGAPVFRVEVFAYLENQHS